MPCAKAWAVQVRGGSPWNSAHAVCSSRRICEMRPGLTPNFRGRSPWSSRPLAKVFAIRRLCRGRLSNQSAMSTRAAAVSAGPAWRSSISTSRHSPFRSSKWSSRSTVNRLIAGVLGRYVPHVQLGTDAATVPDLLDRVLGQRRRVNDVDQAPFDESDERRPTVRDHFVDQFLTPFRLLGAEGETSLLPNLRQ